MTDRGTRARPPRPSFHEMWRGAAAHRPATPPPAATAATPGPAADADCRAWFREQAEARGLDLRDRPQRQPVGLARRPRRRGRRRHRLAPGLRARRRRLRRPARRRLLLRRARRAARRGARSSPSRSPSSTSATRRAPASASPASAPGSTAGQLTAEQAHAAARRGRRHACRRPWSAPGTTPTPSAPTPSGSPGSAPSSSCTSSRAAPWTCTGDPVGVASAIWPHGRWRFDFRGEANHAGTTRLEDRRDPMLTYAEHRARRPQEGPARRGPGHLRQGRRRAERRQRHPLPGARLARLPRRRRGDPRPPSSPRSSRPPAERGERDGVDARRRPGVLHPGRRVRRTPCATSSPRILGGGGAGPRPAAPAPDTTPASCPRPSRPPCCSYGTPPASRTPRPSTPAEDDCVAGVTALADVLEGLACQLTARRPTGLEHAWLGDPGRAGRGHRDGRRTGRITAVPHRASTPRPPAPSTLRGLTLPGLANAHCTPSTAPCAAPSRSARGTFWTWREIMYGVAARLTPDTLLRRSPAPCTPRWRWPASPASASSTTCTTRPAARRYADPNAMGEALIAAAAEAGIRITLLDTAYLSVRLRRGTPGPAPAALLRRHRRRLGRAGRPRSRSGEHARIGAAIHSVRAVPADQLGDRRRLGRGAAAPRCTSTSPSRPPRTTPAWPPTAAPPPGCSPTTASSGPRTTGRPRHPPHRRGHRAARRHRHRHLHVPDHRTGPRRRHRPGRRTAARGLAAVASAATATPSSTCFEEARAMELNERLRTRTRGHWTAAALLRAATADGHAALGWPDAGRLEPGALADFTTIALDSVRTAGPLPRLGAETAVFAAIGGGCPAHGRRRPARRTGRGAPARRRTSPKPSPTPSRPCAADTGRPGRRRPTTRCPEPTRPSEAATRTRRPRHADRSDRHDRHHQHRQPGHQRPLPR